MKRVYALVLILSMILAGCRGTTDNSSDVETAANSELTEDSQKATEVPVTEVPVTEASASEASASEASASEVPASEASASEVPTIVPAAVPTGDTLVDQSSEGVDSSDVLEPIVLDYTYSRKPPVANWSSFAKKLGSLNSSNRWGSALDLRLSDLSELDLTNEFDRMMNIVYDSITKWPEKLPAGFDPASVMENGKNPGIGIRSLHEQGITGKGINIAIIDQPLLLEHIEYGNQIKLYDEVNAGGTPGSMHGPFVASLSVGKSCGTAPEAGLYFIGCYNMDLSSRVPKIDHTYFVEAIDKLIEINKNLPSDEKIRALSISAVWSPDNVGYNELSEAILRAKEEGIFVISGNLFETYSFWDYGLAKDPLSDADNKESYSIYPWENTGAFLASSAIYW